MRRLIVALIILSMLAVPFVLQGDHFSEAHVSDVTPTHVWSFGGVNSLASTAGNWDTGTIPATDGSDDVVFDATSVSDCDWDLEGSFNSILINTGYSGNFDLLRNISTVSTLTVGGTSVFTVSFGNISVGSNLVLKGTAHFTTSPYFALIAGGTVKQTALTAPVSVFYGNVSAHDVQISKGTVSIVGNWTVSGIWDSVVSPGVGATIVFGSHSLVNMTGSGETVKMKSTHKFHALQIDGAVDMLSDIYMNDSLAGSGTIVPGVFSIYYDPSGHGGGVVTSAPPTNLWDNATANSVSSDNWSWSLNHSPQQGEDIYILAGSQNISWDNITTVGNLYIEGWNQILTIPAGQILNVEGDVIDNGGGAIIYYPRFAPFNTIVNGSVYLANFSGLTFIGAVGEPYVFIDGDLFLDGRNDSSNAWGYGTDLHVGSNIKLFVNGTAAFFGGFNNVGSAVFSGCVYSEFRNGLTVRNLTNNGALGLVLETCNITGDLWMENSTVQLSNASWIEHHDYRSKYSKVVTGSLHLKNVTDLYPAAQGSDFLMNGTGTIYDDMATALHAIYIQNGSVYRQLSGLNVVRLEIRGAYYADGHDVNVSSFDSSNGTFSSNAWLAMSGTGVLKTNGHPSGGLSYLAIGAGAVVTLQSDIYILTESGFVNFGTVILNGFHIYLPGDDQSGVGAISSDFSYYYGDSGQVFFNAQSPNAVTYSWDFGDGSTSSLKDPSHTYEASGTYEVTLRVSDGNGNYATASKQIAVVAPPAPPVKFDDSYVMIGFAAALVIVCLWYWKSR